VQIERSFEAAQDAVAALDAASLAGGRAITVKLVRQLFSRSGDRG